MHMEMQRIYKSKNLQAFLGSAMNVLNKRNAEPSCDKDIENIKLAIATATDLGDIEKAREYRRILMHSLEEKVIKRQRLRMETAAAKDSGCYPERGSHPEETPTQSETYPE